MKSRGGTKRRASPAGTILSANQTAAEVPNDTDLGKGVTGIPGLVWAKAK